MEGLSNIAENHTTWQSSTDHGGESSRAVDGGLSSLYGDESCTHTGGGHAIWGLDLGGIADIYYVEVLNRDGATGNWPFKYILRLGETRLVELYFVLHHHEHIKSAKVFKREKDGREQINMINDKSEIQCRQHQCCDTEGELSKTICVIPLIAASISWMYTHRPKYGPLHSV